MGETLWESSTEVQLVVDLSHSQKKKTLIEYFFVFTIMFSSYKAFKLRQAK